MTRNKLSRKTLMQKTTNALRELWLSTTTNADRERLLMVERGMYALDQEQAALKEAVEDLLETYKENVDAASLVAGLQKLVTEEVPMDAEVPASQIKA